MLLLSACSHQGILNNSPSTPTAFSATVHGLAADGSAYHVLPTTVHGLAADGAATMEPVGSADAVVWGTGPVAGPASADPTSREREIGESPQALPTDPPEATVLAQSVPASAQLTEPQMRALLAAVGWPVATREAALAVARCESGWRTDATGSEGERGLFQVHPRWHPDATYDPEGNARAAMRISSGGTDWSAWSCRKVLN